MAFAESSVTLYGRVEVGFGNSKTTNSLSVPGFGSYSETLKTTGMHDGATGLSGSRVGFRGTEDLGGGLKAHFNVETRFLADDGSLKTANMFGEGRSVVGLSGGFGAVDLGRDYTPLFRLVNIQGDVDGASGFSTTDIGQALTSDNGVGYGVRANNSINYTSPNLGGFVARVQLANESGAYTEASNTLVTTTQAKDRVFGLSGTYSAGPLMVGLGFHNGKSRVAESIVDLVTPSASTYDVTGGKTNSWGLAGTYDFEVAKLYANFTQAKRTTEGSAASTKGREFNVGVLVPYGNMAFLAGIGRNRVSYTDGAGYTASGSGTDFMMGMNYDLSKRTRLYARFARIDSLKGSDYNNGVHVLDFGDKTTRYSVGLAHTF